MTENEKVTDKCRECDELVEFECIGMVPMQMLSGEAESDAWFDSRVCTNCGMLEPIEVTEEDIEDAEDRFIEILEKYGFDHGIE